MGTQIQEEIDLQEVLQAVSTVNLKRLKHKWSVGSYGPDVQVFKAKIDFVNYVLDYINPNAENASSAVQEFIDSSEYPFRKEFYARENLNPVTENNTRLVKKFINSQNELFSKVFKSYYEGNFYFTEEPWEWGGPHKTTVSPEALNEVLERISKLENPTLESVFENELAQEGNYETRYKQALIGINARYEHVTTVKNDESINGVVTSALDQSKRGEMMGAEYKNRSFVTKKELASIKGKLRGCPLYQKVDIQTSIGYNPKASDKRRLKSIQRLQKNDGRNYLQKVINLTNHKVDEDLVSTLNSVAYHDPVKEIAVLAKTMVKSYQTTGSFNPD